MQRQKLIDALRPFALVDAEIRARYVVRGPNHVMVQIGERTLTWGDFKAATDALKELSRDEDVGF